MRPGAIGHIRDFMMRTVWMTVGLTAATLTTLLAAGLIMPALLIVPVPIAYYRAMRQPAAVALILAVSLVVPALLFRSAMGAGLCLLSCAAGILLGTLVRKRFSLGQSVAIMTALIYGLWAAHTALFWEEVQAAWRLALDAQRVQFEQATTDGSAVTEQAGMVMEWLRDHLADVGFGLLFGAVLVVTTVGCALLYRRLAENGVIEGVNWQFARMRMPEHLVWLAILLALLWFVDNRWPTPAVRFLSWNAAVAMTVIYWLNGLSLSVFAWMVLGLPVWLGGLLLLGMFLSNMHQAFAILGLFDTWWDFRIKAVQWARSRRSSDTS